MPLAILLNPDDPLYDFEHAMAHREYLAIMAPLNRFSAIPYFIEPLPLPPPPQPADMWNLDHQQAHNDFNRHLPSNYANGYTTTFVQPPAPTPPPVLPPPPPYYQANPLSGGTFGIPQAQILIEGIAAEDRSWWTFVNHQQHYIANNAILPLPTTQPTTAGTPPGEATLSNPWWWASLAPVIYPFW